MKEEVFTDQYNPIELTMKREANRTFWFLFCRIVMYLEFARTKLRKVNLKSGVTVRKKIRHICLHSKTRI